MVVFVFKSKKVSGIYFYIGQDPSYLNSFTNFENIILDFCNQWAKNMSPSELETFAN